MRKIRLDDSCLKHLTNISVGFTRKSSYILRNSEKSHTENIMYFADRGCVRTWHNLYRYATAAWHRNVGPPWINTPCEHNLRTVLICAYLTLITRRLRSSYERPISISCTISEWRLSSVRNQLLIYTVIGKHKILLFTHVIRENTCIFYIKYNNTRPKASNMLRHKKNKHTNTE